MIWFGNGSARSQQNVKGNPLLFITFSPVNAFIRSWRKRQAGPAYLLPVEETRNAPFKRFRQLHFDRRHIEIVCRDNHDLLVKVGRQRTFVVAKQPHCTFYWLSVVEGERMFNTCGKFSAVHNELQTAAVLQDAHDPLPGGFEYGTGLFVHARRFYDKRSCLY